jgi:hypothetical protein
LVEGDLIVAQVLAINGIGESDFSVDNTVGALV